MTVWVKRLGGIVLFLAVWEGVARAGVVPVEYFPSVPTIAAALTQLFASPDFLRQIALTWTRTLAGLGVAIALGLAVAIAAGRYALLRRMLEPLVEMLRVLPPPAIVPLSIFFIGLGLPLFLFIIGFAAVWPIYINAANALAAAEPVQLLTGRSFGYSRWEILLFLRLPAALPEIVTGVRLAAAIALLAAVAAEMLAGQNGLGYVLYNAAFTLRIADMFAIMVVVGVSGVLLNLFVARTSRLFVGWHLDLAATGEAR
jgi:ABC-type nitrate/sulfonate/bicarbonate transport system permease component